MEGGCAGQDGAEVGVDAGWAGTNEGGRVEALQEGGAQLGGGGRPAGGGQQGALREVLPVEVLVAAQSQVA